MEKKIGMIIINPEIGHDFRQEGGDQWLYALALKYDEIKGLEALAEVFGTTTTVSRMRRTYLMSVSARMLARIIQCSHQSEEACIKRPITRHCSLMSGFR
jgi:hypothetical protein